MAVAVRGGGGGLRKGFEGERGEGLGGAQGGRCPPTPSPLSYPSISNRPPFWTPIIAQFELREATPSLAGEAHEDLSRQLAAKARLDTSEEKRIAEKVLKDAEGAWLREVRRKAKELRRHRQRLYFHVYTTSHLTRSASHSPRSHRSQWGSGANRS